MPRNTTDPDDGKKPGTLPRWKSRVDLTFRRRKPEQKEDPAKQGDVREPEDAPGREDIMNNLISIYESIRDDGGTYFDAQGLMFNWINCYKVKFDHQPVSASENFFIPMTKEELDQLEIDLTDEDTKEDFETRGAIWDGQRDDTPLPEVKVLRKRFRTAQGVCTLLRGDFLGIKRKNPSNKDSSSKLMKFTAWKYESCNNPVIADEFRNDLNGSGVYSAPCDIFEGRNGLPHVLGLLPMGYEPREEELHLPELLTILAIAITQMRKPELRAHNVIPVKILSFSGCYGRIMESFYNISTEHLCIKTSCLYDFSTEEVGLENADLFLRHMASRLEGNTNVPYVVSEPPS